jgi:hypothetical protein
VRGRVPEERAGFPNVLMFLPRIFMGKRNRSRMKCDCSNERIERIECRRQRPSLVVALAGLGGGLD